MFNKLTIKYIDHKTIKEQHLTRNTEHTRAYIHKVLIRITRHSWEQSRLMRRKTGTEETN